MIFGLRGKISVAPLLQEAAGVFRRHGKQVYLAGGAVRDMLRGKKAADWDLATDALAGEVCAMFRTVVPTGLKHGTVTVLYKGHAIEVTTFRTEADYTDGRRPDTVRFSASIAEDLARRDFTMNAIAAELPSGRLVDPFNGRKDIKNRLIRCVGDAGERFGEDGLRPLRAVRFAATLGFTPDAALLAAIPERLAVTAKVSPERVRAEFEKIIMSPAPQTALTLMRETGLLDLLLPELAACVGVEQKGHHRFDVFTHSVLAADYAAQAGAEEKVRLAALLHDIGKPACARLVEGIWTFYNHEKESARLVRALMLRLRFPNALIDAVVHLIEEHMFHYEDVWNNAAVRRFIVRVGEENIAALFQLRAADSFGTAGHPPPADALLPLQRRIDAVLARKNALSLKDIAVNGRDLIQLGIPAGKRLGTILNQLFEAVLEDPELNTKEKLLEIARHYAGK